MLNPFDFEYTHAIVYRVPNCYKEAVFRQKDVRRLEPIDINRAKEQHTEYINILRKLGLDVIELPADESLPDSLFIDSTAVICNGNALIAKPNLQTRKKETEIIKCILKREGLNVIEITDQHATLDASDVLYTGREFFVALSKRTNILGAKALASAFPDIPVALIKIKKGLSLKAYVSVAGPDLLAVNPCDLAKDILRQMKEMAEFKKYQIISVPDQQASNCLYANGTLLHCSQEEWPNSYDTFCTKIDFPRIEVKNSEFTKVDRYLTCRTLLFAKKRLPSVLLNRSPQL